jgi:hypothetical protein
VTGIREIKTFVAKRKIGDAVVAHRQGQPVPIVKRTVFDFSPHKLTFRVGEKDVSDFAAVPLGERNGKRIFRQLRYCGSPGTQTESWL